MFTQLYNWLIGRILVKCAYCGAEEYIAAVNYNPQIIHFCSNSCGYAYYEKYCVSSSPSFNKQFDGMVRIQITPSI